LITLDFLNFNLQLSGKTVQTIAFLQYLHKHMDIQGPFLVIAPLSTTPHWQREIEEWTDMNSVVFHGPIGSRQVLKRYEFWNYNGQVTVDPVILVVVGRCWSI
jgi:SNF2 family DNA or RNA helicase